MTDKPAPTPTRPIAPDTGLPYVIPAGWKDTTAEHTGTITGIVGYPKAAEGQAAGITPADRHQVTQRPVCRSQAPR
jgi:hypothetical protein